MSTEQELPENIADAPEIELPSGGNTGVKKKMPIGRRITKENAKQYQISASKAKRLRKEARAKMLAALTESLDMGQELLKAMKGKDSDYLNMIERATRLVGLQHDQSPEAVAQKVQVDAKTDNKVSGNVNITIKGLDDE